MMESLLHSGAISADADPQPFHSSSIGPPGDLDQAPVVKEQAIVAIFDWLDRIVRELRRDKQHTLKDLDDEFWARFERLT